MKINLFSATFSTHIPKSSKKWKITHIGELLKGKAWMYIGLIGSLQTTT